MNQGMVNELIDSFVHNMVNELQVNSFARNVVVFIFLIFNLYALNLFWEAVKRAKYQRKKRDNM